MFKLTVVALFSLFAAIAGVGDANAASEYCKKVAAKPTDQLTQDESDKCLGPIIAAAMCKGWREGKAKSGCPDHKTAAEWAKSTDDAIKNRGEMCLITLSMDVQCGIN